MNLKSLKLHNPIKFSSTKTTGKPKGTQAVPTVHRPKATRSVKVTVKSFFQKLFSTATNPRLEKAQRHVADAVSAGSHWQNLDPNGEFRSVIAVLQTSHEIDGKFPEESAAEVGSDEILPHIPSPLELAHQLKGSMQELCDDMVAQGQLRRTCVVGDRTLTAELTMSNKGPVLQVFDDFGVQTHGMGGLSATLAVNTLIMNRFNVLDHSFTETKLKNAREDAVLLLKSA